MSAVRATTLAAIGAWSSTDSETGMQSSDAGLARWRTSLASAVNVFWIVAKPECSGPRVVSCNGSPEKAGEYMRWQRATHSAAQWQSARRSASKASASAGNVEVAVRQHGRRARDDQRAVGRAVELDLDVLARDGERGKRSPVHLRHASIRQRVLHAPGRAVLPQAASIEQGDEPLRDLALAACRPRRLHAWIERREVRAESLEAQRGGHVERVECAAAVVHDERGVTDRRGVRADEGEPVLRGKRYGDEPGASERLRRRHHVVVELRVTFTDQHHRHVRERSEIGDADGAARRHDRMHARIQHRDEHLQHRGRDAGAAARHAGRAREHGRTHDVARMARTHADGARPNRAKLVGVALRRRDRLSGVGAERGVEAVDRRIAGSDACRRPRGPASRVPSHRR